MKSTFTLRATDSKGATGTQTFTISVYWNPTEASFLTSLAGYGTNMLAGLNNPPPLLLGAHLTPSGPVYRQASTDNQGTWNAWVEGMHAAGATILNIEPDMDCVFNNVTSCLALYSGAINYARSLGMSISVDPEYYYWQACGGAGCSPAGPSTGLAADCQALLGHAVNASPGTGVSDWYACVTTPIPALGMSAYQWMISHWLANGDRFVPVHEPTTMTSRWGEGISSAGCSTAAQPAQSTISCSGRSETGVATSGNTCPSDWWTNFLQPLLNPQTGLIPAWTAAAGIDIRIGVTTWLGEDQPVYNPTYAALFASNLPASVDMGFDMYFFKPAQLSVYQTGFSVAQQYQHQIFAEEFAPETWVEGSALASEACAIKGCYSCDWQTGQAYQNFMAAYLPFAASQGLISVSLFPAEILAGCAAAYPDNCNSQSVAAAASANFLAGNRSAVSQKLESLIVPSAGQPGAITKSAGDEQSTPLSQAFPTALVVTVTDVVGNPVAGASVTFTVTAGATGASGVFNSTGPVVVSTNPTGNATAPLLTANGFPGQFTVTATVNALTATFTLANLGYILGASSATVGSAAGNGTLLLSGYGPWTATSNASWLQLSAGSVSGAGSALIQFNYAANTSPNVQTGTLTIAGLPFTVTQAGASYVPVYPVTTLASSGFYLPQAVAVDAQGNVYIADTANNAVKEWSPATQQTVALVSGLNAPAGVAVDASGNVWIADSGNNALKYWNPVTASLNVVVPTGLSNPQGIALDDAGNVYIADSGSQTVKEWIAANEQLSVLVGSGLNSPAAVAVDAQGNVYIADSGANNAVFEWSAGQLTPLVSGLSGPAGVAVDGQGNVYIGDTGNNALKQWNAATQLTTAWISSGLNSPEGLAVDAQGNVYLADTNNSAIKKLTPAYLALSVSSVTETSPAGADSVTAQLLPAGTPLSATSDQSWLTITGIAGGTLNFSFTANTATLNRTGHITVLGQPVTVTQNGLTAQTITFGALANQTFGGAPITVGATASSGLAVSFASTTPAVCTVSGATVTLAAGGTCTIQATQAGNSSYAPATPVSQSFQVMPESQTITFGALSNQTFGAAPFAVSATASSGLAVSLASTTPAVCTVSGGTVTLVAPSTCTIEATQAGNNNWAAATPVDESFSVLQQGQTIAFATLPDQVFNSTPIALSATASSGLPVGFASTTPAVCTVSASSVTMVSLGQCSIQATQAGNAVFAAATPVTQSFQVAQETLGAASLTVAGAGGSNAVEIGFLPLSAMASWSAGANASWLHLGSASGAGAAIVPFTVDANPNPTARTGAITLDSGVALTVTQAGTNYMGPGPLVTLVSAGVSAPSGVAVDSSGNVYIADTNNGAIEEWSAATQQVTPLVSGGLSQPLAVAVDGSGNVYIADTGNNAIKEWSPATPTNVATLVTGLAGPSGVAVDGAGNVYFADTGNNAIKEWSPLTTSVATLVSTGLSGPTGVAVDVGGNVYFADTGNAAIKEWSPATPTNVATLVSSGLSQPVGVAVDGAGNVYIADSQSNVIAEWSAATQQATALVPAGLSGPSGVAVDGAGNVYIADSGHNAIEEMPVAFVGPASLTEPVSGGTDALLPVLPATAPLVGIFAPTSDQSWLTIGSVANSVVNFSFTANTSTATRTAHIIVLGQPVTVTQNGLTAQTITFGALANQTFGGAPIAVGATASSGLAVSFASTTSAVCTVSGATVTLVAGGTCTIQATQAGNSNYAPATPVSQSFQVMPESQTIAFGALSNQTFGAAPFAVSATASSGLAVSLASTTPALCTVSGGTVTLVAAGTCTIQATQAGNGSYTAATPVSQSFQVMPESQTITFGALSNQTFGAAPFPVSATASSGLAVSFASTTPAVCTVSSGTVTLVSVGACTVQATQAGNANWAAAISVNQSFQVAQGSQTITFAALSNHAFGTAPFTISATASSGLAVTFVSTPAVCTVSGATVTLVAVGTCTIQAKQAGNANWAAATAVNRSFTVTQGSQTITFGALANQTFGVAPVKVGATASSGLAVSFASTTTAVCTISGTTVTLVAVGACTIEATQTGNANWAAATPVNQSFQVTPASQTITFAALSNQAFGAAPFTVSATASSGLAVSFASTTTAVCTESGATVTLVGSGTCTIQATQAGNTDYAAATPVSRSFAVSRGSQTITFGALSNQAFGAAPFTVGATASSGLAVSFNSQTTKVCTVSGTTVTLVAAGTCTIQATQAGNTNWTAAAAVNQSFQVTPESQNITFGALSNQVFGAAPFKVAATASSGLAVSFASTTTAVCTVSGATVTLAAAGACTIQATQPGNTNWAAATPVSQSFQVTQKSQTITFGALSSQVFGAAPFTVSATASSGLAVSFASTTTAVCTISGATVTLAAAGACTIQATQAGNTNYAAATPVNQSFQVTQESQTITFGTLSSQVFGSAPFTVAATASSGLAVGFASTTTAVCTVSGATVTLVAVGTCTIQATQAGNANYTAATPVNRSFAVTKGSQTITFGALSNLPFGSAPFTVGATASSGLAVSFNSQTTKVCTVSGTTVTLVAAGTCTIQATQAGNTNWTAAAAVNQSFQVTPESQTIVFVAPATQALGAPPFTVSATASSGLAVSFASVTPTVCTVSGSTVTLVAAGTCTIHAMQTGNTNFAAATPVNQSFLVT
jgi:sugar lactone lactonase YvrE